MKPQQPPVSINEAFERVFGMLPEHQLLAKEKISSGMVKPIPLGYELNRLVAEKERQWAQIPESFRLEIPNEDMEEFATGWDSYNPEGLAATLRLIAATGRKSHLISVYGEFSGNRFTVRQKGQYARIQYFLAENHIAWTGEWINSNSPATKARYDITIKWGE